MQTEEKQDAGTGDRAAPAAVTRAGLPLHMQLLRPMPEHKVHFIRVRSCEAAAASEYQCLPFFKPISRPFGKVK